MSIAAMLLAATLCAEAALMPVGALLFGRVSLAGLALKFLAIPIMTVTQIAGMAAVALYGVSEPASALVGWVAHLAATWLVESTRLLDLFPWLAFRVPARSRFSCLPASASSRSRLPLGAQRDPWGFWCAR